MIGYAKTNDSKDEWLTPPEVIQALGEFDLDPCAPIERPWPTAKQHYTLVDDGLVKAWYGRVWLNPPYTRNIMDLWLEKLCLHGNGITLIPARTETESFQRFVFDQGDSILFLKGRLHFYHVNGQRAKFNSGAPSVLVSYGDKNSEAIANSGLPGKHVLINSIGVIMCGFDKTWSWVLKIAMIRLNKATVQEVYEEVESIAPDKVMRNKNYKAKVRQQLQKSFKNVSKGIWEKAN